MDAMLVDLKKKLDEANQPLPVDPKFAACSARSS